MKMKNRLHRYDIYIDVGLDMEANKLNVKSMSV